MRHLLHILPLVLSCLLSDACTRSNAPSGLTPTTIEIQGYYGRSTTRTIDFHVDGQPIAGSAVTITTISDPTGAFTLSPIPLSDQFVLTFMTNTEAHARAFFELSYRGQDYFIRVEGTAQAIPWCEPSSEECAAIVFNTETAACERTPLSMTPCERTDCANPGTCESGVCLHQEIAHEAPSCFAHLPTTKLTPVWVNFIQEKTWPDGPLVLDEEGNSYFFEMPAGELTSFDHDAWPRWSVPFQPKKDVPIRSINVRVVGDRVFVLDPVTRWLSVFSRSDGKPLWSDSYYDTLQALPVGDAFWTLIGIDIYGRSVLTIQSAATGDDIASVPLPPTVDGEPASYFYNLIADENQHVFLIGTSDVTSPQTTVVAAYDASTHELLWSTIIARHEPALWQPLLISGSTLLFSNGVSFDVTTRQLSRNDVWQFELKQLAASSFALNADARGFLASTPRHACLTTTLNHVDARKGTTDWRCFLGSTFPEGGFLHTTPKGSAVLVMPSGHAPRDHRALIRIINAEGQEVFSSVLSFDGTTWPEKPLVAIRGQRLLLVQEKDASGFFYLAAYDIPELLTK